MDEILTDEDVMRIIGSYTAYPPAGEPVHLHGYARALICDLIRYIDSRASIGNDDAAKTLAFVALISTHTFQDRFLEKPSRFGPEFHAQATVPVLLSKRKRDRELAEKVVKLSKVGVLRPTNTQGKQISSRVSLVAERLYDYVIEARFSLIATMIRSGHPVSVEKRKELEEIGTFLPPITRENAVKLYWPRCNRELIRLYGEKFENAPDFAHYWTKKGIKELEGAAQRNEVRKRIKKDLKQALVSLAPSA